MNRELNNPSYRFLFDPYIPEHAYYRWRLFSLLQGDSMYNWSVKEFVMFKGGSVWVPPPLPPGYTSKSSLSSIYLHPTASFKISKDNKILEKSLSQKQLSTLRNLLRHLTADRKKVAEIMVWALDHNECAKEVFCRFLYKIIDNFQQSLTIKTTALNIKAKMMIARLYALSDILYNSSIDRSGAGDFRRL
ncbi:hypothetical protein HZS_3170 [Henneguya salminicola]|nr:hypothetical protein HZS_3170 [Henneguya salminicola]